MYRAKRIFLKIKMQKTNFFFLLRWEVASFYKWAVGTPTDKVNTFLKVPIFPTWIQLKVQNSTLQSIK